MSITSLTRPARRFLLERLERLQDSLENLGQRLRESISLIIGSQIGDTIRDALDRVLHTQQTSTPRRSEGEMSWGRDKERRPAHHQQEFRRYDNDQEQFWYDDELEDPERRPSEEDPQPAPEPKPSRWKAVLAGLVQLASCWLQQGSNRPSLKKLLGVGAAVGATTIIAGPFLGGVVLTGATAVLLSGLANTNAFAGYSSASSACR